VGDVAGTYQAGLNEKARLNEEARLKTLEDLLGLNKTGYSRVAPTWKS
jgi:hypothetical protein